MKKLKPVHPFLFASFPVLSMFSSNLDIAGLSDLWRPLVVVCVSVCVLWFVAYRLTKDSTRSAIGVTCFVIVAIVIGLARDLISGIVGGRHHLLVSVFIALVGTVLLLSGDRIKKWRSVLGLGLFIVIFAVADVGVRALLEAGAVQLSVAWILWALYASYFALRLKSKVDRMTSLLNWVGIFLVLQPLIVVGLYTYESNTASGVVSDGEVRTLRDVPTSEFPDVYYIVLDGYGREDSLKKFYDVPGKSFASSLRERGFYVADQSQANYYQTHQSLGTSLNMDYLTELLDVDPETRARHHFQDLIGQSKVSETFDSANYETISIVTVSDIIQTPPSDVMLEGERTFSDFEQLLISRSPLLGFIAEDVQQQSHRQLVLAAYDYLDGLSVDGPPKFVYAHIVSPHPPFIFGVNGEAVVTNTTIRDGTSHHPGKTLPIEVYRKAYRDQIQYIRERTLLSIDLILERSERPPIIIVQGDHGPRMLTDFEEASNTEFEENMPILNAYFVPEDIKSELYANISPVNTFRLLFDKLFGTEYGLLEDKSFYSKWSLPYVYTELPLEEE